MPANQPPIPKKFLTNEGDNTLRKRLEQMLPRTRDFDCLVGYFFISGFYRLYPALESVEKIRILIGLKNEQVIHGLMQIANTTGDADLEHGPSTAGFGLDHGLRFGSGRRGIRGHAAARVWLRERCGCRCLCAGSWAHWLWRVKQSIANSGQ